MSIYNLQRNKSLKKLNDMNPKAAHILPQSILQPNRQSSVNLSKLGSYKGKFSLTSKYNSLCSQNNNQQRQWIKQIDHKGKFMSQSNKENVLGMANMMTEKMNDRIFMETNLTDKIPFDHQVQQNEPNNTKQNLYSRPKQNQLQTKYQLNLKTQPTHQDSQEQAQNMKKIIMAASTINLKNAQPIKGVSANNKELKNIHKPLIHNYDNNRDSIDHNQQKVCVKENNKNNSKTQKSIVGQRRSKFHKYDNSTDQNEFLVIEQGLTQPAASHIQYHKKPSIEKKPSIQKKTLPRQTLQRPQPKKPQQPHKIHTQTIKLHELQISKQKPQHEHQAQILTYQQSLKHITYSMIKMISLVSKIDIKQGVGSNTQKNVKIFTQIRNQIFALYNQELGKYVDKLNIREEIVAMAKQEEEFMKKKSQIHLNDAKAQQNTVSHNHNTNHQPQILIINSPPQSSRYDYSISHQQPSYTEQQDPQNSLLHQYQIREPSCDSASFNNDSLNHREQNSSSENFFDFDSINRLEIMPSGRNLLETFNNQHLCNELQIIDNQLEESKMEQDHNYCAIQDNNYNFCKQTIQEGSHGIDLKTLQTFEENLCYGLRQISVQEQYLAKEQDSSQSHICRKLFNQQQSALKARPNLHNKNLSPITHLYSTTSVLSTHNQPSLPALLPEHYYQVISSQQSSAIQSSRNYLQLQRGDTIKLLRKVDTTRWIAELEDRIGFVDELTVTQRVKLVGRTARKSQNEPELELSN